MNTGKRPLSQRLRTRSPLRPTVLMLLLALVATVGWNVYSSVSAPMRITDRLEAAFDGSDRLDVRVDLSFEPEPYHFKLFQSHGLVGKIEGTTVAMRRMREADVRSLAQNYWIDRIDLAEPAAA